jgi:hypothetical protein
MDNLKSVAEIQDKIAYYQKRLDKIEEGIQAQLDLSFFQRNERVCKFLDIEKRAYSLLVQELKWVIDEK